MKTKRRNKNIFKIRLTPDQAPLKTLRQIPESKRFGSTKLRKQKNELEQIDII
jgi:hypothetical protein